MVLILTPLIQGGESRSRRWRARGGASWSRRCRSAMAAMVCVIFRGKKHRTSGKIIYKWWIFRDFRGKIICACWNYVEFHGNIIYKWDCMKGKYRALVFFSPSNAEPQGDGCRQEGQEGQRSRGGGRNPKSHSSSVKPGTAMMHEEFQFRNPMELGKSDKSLSSLDILMEYHGQKEGQVRCMARMGIWLPCIKNPSYGFVWK